ncbi:MAG: hypothetical protein K2X27_10975 [Candidatus Obscuribacterales bacterium]|nr:hypothetical protein [Candidatus Obscuribacterales bacterium]
MKSILRLTSPMLTALLLLEAQAVFAAPYPGTGAPLAAARQTTAEGDDPGNPYAYPFLANVAKSLAKNGFPASFFLGLDNKGAPGIDLRTLLLYEAGVLKTPVRLYLPAKKKKDDFPSLSVGAMPLSSGQMPSALPQISTGTSPLPLPPAESGEQLKKPENPEKPGLSLDLNKFSIDISHSPLKNEITTTLAPDLETLALSSPLASESGRSNENNNFRFWTVPAPAALPKTGSESIAAYDGSFVMLSPGALKSIDGRAFSFTKGELLAYSQGKAIIVDTGLISVRVEAGAAALVDVVGPGLSRVRVLESSKTDRAVGVRFSEAGKGEEIRLAAGEDLLIADHSLTDAEKSKQLKSASDTAGSGDVWKKSKFNPQALISSDPFFSTELANQNQEQRSAVLALKKRIR